MATSTARTYSPSEAAERSGFSLDTLRYYERAGLLTPVARTAGGRRAYSDGDLEWLSLVRCLRDTGMPIAQVRRYSELAMDASTMAERLALLEVHDRQVQEAIDALRAQQDRLQEKIAWYRSELR
jgi:DNA-binding transcriptional MerR regulator